MKFGIFLPTGGPFATKSVLVDTAKEAKSLGFDSLIVYDRVVQERGLHAHEVVTGSVEAQGSSGIVKDPVSFDSLPTLTHLSGMISGIELGVSALVLPTRHPVLVAKEAGTLDDLSGGRFILGVCKGSRAIKSSFDALGIPYEKRWSIFKEYVQALRALLTKPVASFRGKYLSFSGIEIYPRPKRSRILMGVGMSPEGIKAAAALGDGWLPGHRPPDEIKSTIEKIRAERKKLGLTNEKYELGLNLYTGIAKTRDEALKKASKTITARANVGTFPGNERDVVQRRALVGSPDSIISRVDEYKKAGVDEIFHMVVFDSIEGLRKSMKMLSQEVFPSFRTR